MTKIDYYKGLDDSSVLKVELTMPEIAARCCELNRGAHRLLSALVHELRKKQAAWVDETRQEDLLRKESARLNLPDSEKRSPLADVIEKALNEGLDH